MRHDELDRLRRKEAAAYRFMLILLLTIIVATMLAAALILTATTIADARTDDRTPVGPGSTGQGVLEVQYALRSQGWVLPVDGRFGPRTLKVVSTFQRFNGLTVDGIVGPVTWNVLARASRTRAPAPAPTELNGLPFAPPGLDSCDEMQFYRAQAGLPERFDAIGWRESRCDNTVGNYCCHGWWANYLSSHLSRQSAYRIPIMFWCQADSVDDIRGPTDLQKQKQACVTRVVFDISGMSPWSL